MSDQDFEVDLATLMALIERMGECERTLETLTNDVEASVAKMQQTWEGEVAIAQRAAHAQWEEGLKTMRTAITDLKTMSTTARTNYETAANTNLAMWEDVQ